MKIIETTFEKMSRERLLIGFEGENQRATVRIDCASVFAEYPNATPTLIVKPLFADAYPVVVDRNGTCVDWLITSEILSFTGDGEIQLTFVKDQVICKSAIAKIRVCRSLQVTGDMPDPVAQWIDDANRKLAEVDAQIVELEGMVDTATDAATRAELSASTASTKAEQAAGSAATATEKATEATNAAGTATAKAAEAQTAAQTATEKATAAAESERIATAKAVEATTAAGTATTKAEQATEAAETATEKAGDASASATAAHASEINAAESADDALAAQTAAEAAKRAAEGSATQAATSAQGASQDAQTATTKAQEAAQSATNAATSAGTATTKAEEAAASAQAAQDAKTAVEQTAEQLADSLDQIEQNKQDIAELDERKANIDGYYPDMTVGNAEQLNSSKYVENSEPYTLRTSGGSADIGNREYVDAVVGGTLAWNQAVRDEASENSTDFADVVTVTDAVEDAAGVRVKIEPVQDLHGYDHPWPAGGGKNLLGSKESKTFDVPTANSSFTFEKDSSQVTFTTSGLSSSLGYRFNDIDLKCTLPAGTYYFSSNISNQNTGSGLFVYNADTSAILARARLGEGTRFALSDTTTIRLGASLSVSTASGTYWFQLESGSAATSYVPYSNICPITGWDGVKVTRTGKNLFGGYTVVNAYIPQSGRLANSSGDRCYIIAIMPSMTYAYNIVRTALTQDSDDIQIGEYYGNERPVVGDIGTRLAIQTYSSNIVSGVFTTSSNAKWIAIKIGSVSKTNIEATISTAQVEISSVVTDYEAYAGQVYDITLPSEAGTVYGGELTVNADGSGSLVVDRAKKILNGTEPYGTSSYASNENYAHMILADMSNSKQNQWAIMCDKLSMNGSAPYSNSGVGIWQGGSNVWYICVKKELLESDNSAGMISWIASNRPEAVYYLAQPQTYSLSASEIRTLLGANNVWADTGDLALTYTGTDEHLTLESGKKYLSRISGTDSMLLGSGQEITAAKGQDNVFDLTKMFGTAVADYVYGQGAAFFRKWFGKQLYPYNAGELLSVEGLQSHDMVGFNLFDAEAVLVPLGFVKQSDGSLYLGRASDVQTATVLWANKARYDGTICISYEYKNNSGATSGGARFRFDYADGTYGYLYPSPVATYTAYRIVSTTGKKVKQITYDFGSGTTSTWLKNVCVNFSHNNSRNGEYAPYEKHSYPLDSSVILRGIPKVGANGVYWDGDRYLPDGTVERKYGVVDLGTLDWSSGSGGVHHYTTLSDALTMNGTPSLCGQYSNHGYLSNGWASLQVGEYAIYNNTLRIYDNTNLIAAEFKQFVSGVYLIYELATPTTETAQPYHSTQWVSDWGTEEFVSTGLVPVGTETRYPANLRDKLQHLPDAASGNGSYLITQTDGQMVLTPFPAPPSTAGNYVLKATVVNGVATYTWEVAT